MKIKTYEKIVLIKLLIMGIFILELVFFYLLYSHKEFNYKKIDGIIVKDNVVALVLTKEDKKILYKNSNLIMNDKIRKYTILEDEGVFIKKGNKKYYEVLIKTKTDKKYKTSDSIQVNLKDNKYRIIEMFKLIWGGV